jgi:hypothetical protein
MKIVIPAPISTTPLLPTMKHLWLEFRHPGYYAEVWRGMVEVDKAVLIYRIYRHFNPGGLEIGNKRSA